MPDIILLLRLVVIDGKIEAKSFTYCFLFDFFTDTQIDGYAHIRGPPGSGLKIARRNTYIQFILNTFFGVDT